MILDANLLLYAVDRSSRLHAEAANWLVDTMRGSRRVGVPWQTIGAFLRISTHPRAMDRPLRPEDALSYVRTWLAQPVTWVPPASERTVSVYGSLAGHVPIAGNLVPDAMLAALAIEHGVTVMTCDTDFARFPGVQWADPLR
jgi:toxin-antitoxin system PIN domain toxin